MYSKQIERQIEQDKVRHLFAQYPMVLAGNLIAGTLIFLYYRFEGAGLFILLWFSALLILTAVRFVVLLSFRKREERFSFATWLNVYMLLTGLTGALFGSLELSERFIPSFSSADDAILALILAGVCSAAIMTNAASLPAVAAFLVPCAAPLLISHIALEADHIHTVLALVFLVYLAAMISMTRRLSAFMDASLRLRHENAELLGEVSKGRLELESFFELSRSVLVIASADGYFKRVNPAFCRILGYTREELLSRKSIELIHPQDWEPTLREAEKQLAGGATLDFTNRYIAKDGSARTFSWKAVMEPKAGLFYATAEDVTEKLKAEAALKIQAAIIANIAEGVQMTRVRDDVIVHANRKFETMFGYAPGELIGRHVSILNYPAREKDSERTAEEINGAIMAKGEWRGEIHNVKKHGTPFWSAATVTRYQDAEHGDVMLTVQKDVTEIKALQDKIAESETWHRTLFHKAPDAIFLGDTETGILLDVNETGCKLLGKTRGQIIGAHHSTIHPPGFEKDARAQFQRHSKGGGEIPHDSFVVRADGEDIPVEITAHLLRLGGKTLMLANFRDIRERKKAEIALRESERTLSALISNLSGAVYRCRNDRDWTVEYFSDGVAELTGHAPSDFMGEAKITFGSLIHPDDAQMVRDKVQEALSAKGKFTIEYRIRTAGGQERVVWEQGHGVYLDTGELLALEGFVTDITAAKKTEETLRESEERFRLIFENAPMGIMRFDSKGVIIQCNEKLAELVGAPREKIIGLDMPASLTNPGQRAAVAEALAGRIGYFEGDYVSVTGGKSSIIRTIYTPFFTKDGQLAGGMSITEDISERKKAEEALRASERKFLRFFMMVPIPLGVVSNEGVITHFNERFTGVYGYRTEDVPTINQWWERAYPDESYRRQVMESWGAAVAKAAKEGRHIEPIEYKVTCKNGEERIALISGVTLEDSLLATFIDITGRKKAEESLKNAKTEAEEATARKVKFVSLVAHDLKNPIGAISGFLRHILIDPDPGMSPANLEIIKRVAATSEQMSRMIDEIMDVTRFTTGKVKPNMVFFEPKDLVAIVFGQVSLMACEKGITLVNEVPEHARLYADLVMCRQALMNVVANAIKFCGMGDRVRVYFESGASSLVVEDTGVGIDKSLLADIFRMDVHTSTLGTAGEKGTGLGLPYVQEIMRAHGGDIRAESEPGKGSRFHLTLPAVKPLALVADDDPATRALLRAFLTEMDFNVELAKDGRDAMDALGRISPHLLMVDISMPEMDGLAVIQAVRAERKYSALPIIVMTGDDSVLVKERALRLGANDFLSKPLDQDVTALRINRLVLTRDFIRS